MADLENFVDEQGANLNEYEVTTQSGEVYRVKLIRKATITQAGTPLNAENLNKIITAVNGKVDNNSAGVSGAMNALATEEETPQDNDYFVSQKTGGGETDRSFRRRKFSKLFDYVNAKLQAQQLAFVLRNNYTTDSTFSLSTTKVYYAVPNTTNAISIVGSTTISVENRSGALIIVGSIREPTTTLMATVISAGVTPRTVSGSSIRVSGRFAIYELK